jgi:hypothetical protein
MKKFLFTFAALVAMTAASAQIEKTTRTTTETKTENSVQPHIVPQPTVSTTTTVVKHKPAIRKRTVGTNRRTVRSTTRTEAVKPALETKTTKVIVPAQ